MKYFTLILSLLFYNCGSYSSASSSIEVDSTVLIRVECQQHAEAAVVQALRLVRISDLEKESDGSVLVIKARYKVLTDQKALQINNDLISIPGVLDIQFEQDGMPAKNIF